MLAAVLIAIAAGGLVAAAWLRRQPGATVYLPAIALAAGAILVASYASFRLRGSETWTADWYRILWFTGVITFPVAVASGVLFTLTGERLDRARGDDVRAASWLTSANTIRRDVWSARRHVRSAARGSASKRSIFLAAGAYVLIAVLTLRDSISGSRAGTIVVTSALVIAVAGLAAFPWGLMQRNLLSALGREVRERRLANRGEPRGHDRNSAPDGTGVDGATRLSPPRHERLLDVGNAPDRQALHAATSFTGRRCCSRRRSAACSSSATASAPPSRPPPISRTSPRSTSPRSRATSSR